MIILVWCLGLLIASGNSRAPEISSFPELDLISKIPLDTRGVGICKISSDLSTTRPRDIIRVIGAVTIRAEDESMGRGTQEVGGYDEEHELDVLDGTN